jgi:hypothetical protein
VLIQVCGDEVWVFWLLVASFSLGLESPSVRVFVFNFWTGVVEQGLQELFF